MPGFGVAYPPWRNRRDPGIMFESAIVVIYRSGTLMKNAVIAAAIVVALGIAITDFENLIRMLALIVLVFMAYAEKRVYHFLAAGASGTLLLVFMTLAQVS